MLTLEVNLSVAVRVYVCANVFRIRCMYMCLYKTYEHVS